MIAASDGDAIAQCPSVAISPIASTPKSHRLEGIEHALCAGRWRLTLMHTTIEKQGPVVTDGELQAANELCDRLERIGLLRTIKGGVRSRHRAYILTTKGRDAMSFQRGTEIAYTIENASEA